MGVEFLALDWEMKLATLPYLMQNLKVMHSFLRSLEVTLNSTAVQLQAYVYFVVCKQVEEITKLFRE